MKPDLNSGLQFYVEYLFVVVVLTITKLSFQNVICESLVASEEHGLENRRPENLELER